MSIIYRSPTFNSYLSTTSMLSDQALSFETLDILLDRVLRDRDRPSGEKLKYFYIDHTTAVGFWMCKVSESIAEARSWLVGKIVGRDQLQHLRE